MPENYCETAKYLKHNNGNTCFFSPPARKKIGAKKLAIVASNDQAFLLGNKYGLVEKEVDETVIVFVSIDVAKTWLGVS